MDAMWIMITVVAGAGCCIPIMAIWTKHRKDIIELQIAANAKLNAEGTAQYAARLQAIEQIVTDKGYDVADQIEALRGIEARDEQGSGTPLNLNKENV